MASESSRANGQSLEDLYPLQTALVPAAILLSFCLLLTGLSLPLLYAQQMVFWKSTYSVWTGIAALWQEQERELAALLFFFSIIFPVLKLGVLAGLWFMRLPATNRARLLHWLGLLGKWSMLDVFVVAILIVLVKLGPLARVEPRIGVYVFTAAIACSMLTTMYIERLARRSLPR